MIKENPHGITFILIGNRLGDLSSIPKQGNFPSHLCIWERHEATSSLPMSK